MFSVIFLFVILSSFDFTHETRKTDFYLYAHEIERELILKNFNDRMLKLNDKEYIFLIHDYTDDSTSKIYENIVHTFEKERTNCSYILVDWSKVEGNDFFSFDQCKTLVERCRNAGADLARFIRTHDIKPEKVHMVGYSHGAYVASAAAKLFPVWFSKKPHKITALDPAKKCFDEMNEKNAAAKLSNTDAVIVTVLYTNAGGYGLDEKHLGTMNFYANGGKKQPGCKKGDNLCSHRRSLLIFNESENSNLFAGVECESYKKNCKEGEFVIFQPSMNIENVIGNYYFDTNPTKPYGKIVEPIDKKPEKDNKE